MKKSRRALAKKRDYSVLFRLDKPTMIDGVITGPGGLVVPAYRGQPVELAEALVEVSYDRPKKRKVLFRAPIDASLPSVNPSRPLLNYDFMYAIDTNTKPIQGERVSVTCALTVQVRKGANRIHVSGSPEAAVELHNVVGDPERLGWRVFCESLLANPNLPAEARVAVFVDSSLGTLYRINRREQPVVEDWHLPEQFELLYATSDSLGTIGNRLIRMCDGAANVLLRQLERGLNRGTLSAGEPGDPFSHFRNWNWNPPVPSMRTP